MSKRNWIKAFAPLDRQRLLQTAAESVNWIEQYGHLDGDVGCHAGQTSVKGCLTFR